MKRDVTILIFFICWGAVIILAALWLIGKEKNSLLDFSRKIAEKKYVYYPVRAPILDSGNEKICWTEWHFYIRAPRRQYRQMAKFFADLQIPFAPVSAPRNTGFYQQTIPADKLSKAAEAAKKYQLRIRKKIVRKSHKLPPHVQYKLGQCILYYGIYGLEAQYNSRLAGQPGIYHTSSGPRSFDRKNFKVISTIQPGSPLRLKQSLLELQCGFMPEAEGIL